MKKKKSEYQKFQDFKTRHNLTDGKIKQIMCDYALSDDQFARTFFTSKYNISEHVFYKMRDYTIIFMLVSPSTCKLIRNKSLRNQIGHNPSGNYNTSFVYYQKLISKRREYLDSFSHSGIAEIALEYSTGNSLYEIASKHNISSPEIVKKLIAIALAKRLVDDQTYKKIKFRSDLIFVKSKRGYLSAESLWNSHG